MLNLQKQPIGFDDAEHSTLNWIGNFSLKNMEFDHEKELMPCVYEPFYMEYGPEYNTFAFDDQCDDLLHVSSLALSLIHI